MRRPYAALLTFALAVAGVALPATAAGAVEPPRVRVTPGSSSVLLGETRQLTVRVTGLANTAVTWSLRRGGGSVDASGLYTPPATLPADPVAVVRATSAEDALVYGEATISVASGVPAGGFAPGVPVTGGSYDTDAGDVNGDGVADVVRLQLGSGSLQLARIVAMVSDGAGGFTTKASGYSYLGNGINDFFGDIVLGDFDSDGDLDAYAAIEAVTTAFNEYTLFRNDGTGAFTPDPVVMAGSGEGRAGARARGTDFDGDGKLDVVRLDRFGTVTLHKGVGNGTFVTSVGLFSTSYAASLAVGDVTGDGRPDIAVGTRTVGGSPIMETFDVVTNDGFGGIATRTTYTASLDPTPVVYDADGDGWNDLVVGAGSAGATHYPPKLLVFRNQATGTGALATTGVQAAAFRPFDLHPAHVDGDGVLDLAGATNHGPVLLRRTGANTFAAMHSTSHVPHHVAVGDFTGDGRTDVYTTFDNVSAFFAGTADTTFAFAVDPVVTWINAGHTAAMTASIRNSTALPEVVWSASRGTFPSMFDRHHYTAPSTASPTGTPVTVTATLSGTQLTASRQILVVNEKFQFTSLGGQHVRQVVTDPSVATTLYAATGSGVYRLNNGGTTAQLLGPTTATGTDAKEVAVVRDGATAALVARFTSGIWRLDLTDPAAVWTDADGGAFSAVSVDALPGTGTVFAATSTGAVRRSTDGGLTWNALGGTSVTKVVAVGPDTVWAVRSAAPRVTVGTYADGTLTLTPRELPEPAAAVHTLAVDPDDRTKAFVAIAESNGRRLFRGTTAGEWTASPVPAVVNQLAVAPDGHVLAADDDTQSVFKSVDDGASWYSLYRGFATNLNVTTVAARADSLTLVGSASGLYTPVDLEPPAVPAVTAGPTGTTGPGGSNAFSFTFTATGASHLCALDDKAWTSCSGSRSYSGPLTSGSHTFSVVAVDENGNESAPGTWSWTVDATPPAVPTITSGPPALTNQTTATFAFTGPGDAAGLLCALDGGTPAACADSVSYPVGEGAHTFSVRSVDEYGNQSTAATRSWTVDVTPPPYFGFTRVPAYWGGSTVTGDATFTWAVDPSLTYACALDSAPVTCAVGSYSATGLADGGHTFGVTASDAAGNARTAAHFWVVDTTPPGPVTITLAPPSSTTETTARFEYTSDTWAFDCALDGEWVPCWSEGATLSGLAPGTHTFTVAGRDDHNRLGPATSYTWTVVADPPPAAPVIESGPSGWARSRTATFTYSLPEGTTAKCALDGAAPAPCDATGVTYTELAEGPHTFAVHAVSATGKPSTPAAASWTVDVTPPAAPAIASGPPARTAAGSATFGWTADDTLGYRCAVDGVTVTCGTGTYTATGLPDGGHNFTLRAVDAAGNESPAAVRGWTVDRTGPTVSLGTVPAAATNVTTAAFAFSTSATDVASFECTVDGDPVDCADGSAEVTVPEGEHTFRVAATDDLGNRGPEVTYDWVVDTIAPVTEIAATTTSLTAARLVRWDEPVAALSGAKVRLELTGTTSAVTAALDCRDAANAAVPCSGAGVRTVLLTPASPLVAGQRYTLRVAGVADAAGNVAETVTAAFRASTSEQETTAGAKAAWRTVASPAAQGGSYAFSDVSGASVTIPFTGTGITFYGVRGPAFGTADVYVDAEKTPRLRVNYYSSSAGSLAKSVSGLPKAKHTLRVVVRGEKGSTRGTGTGVALDAVKVGATTSKTPAATYAWARRSASGASGGAYALEDSRGASYTMSFRGTAFSWVTVLGPQMGKATVTIDGKTVTVDNYASALRYGYVRRFAGLADRVHVVKVTVLGERRSGATGAYVAVDRFAVT